MISLFHTILNDQFKKKTFKMGHSRSVLQISCHLADVWMVNRMNTGFKGLVLWYHGHNIDQKDSIILTKYVTKLSMSIANAKTKKKKKKIKKKNIPTYPT